MLTDEESKLLMDIISKEKDFNDENNKMEAESEEERQDEEDYNQENH